MSTRIKLRNDIEENWTANNPILAKSEPGYETDTAKLKIGDGVNNWNDLDYFIINNFSHDSLLDVSADDHHAKLNIISNSTQVKAAATYRIFYSGGSGGNIFELSLGASGTYFAGNGTSSNPSFRNISDINHNTLTNSHNLTTDIDHDALTNFEANEHINWTASGVGTIDPSNYVDNDTTDHTALSNIGDNTHSQIDTAITNSENHIADNSQAHSDYLLNTGDTATGDYNFASTLWIDSTNQRVGVGIAPHTKFHIYDSSNSIALTITQGSSWNASKLSSIEFKYAGAGQFNAGKIVVTKKSYYQNNNPDSADSGLDFYTALNNVNNLAMSIDENAGVDVIGDFTAGTIQADDGFTGTGAYTNFTIVGGIITSAS